MSTLFQKSSKRKRPEPTKHQPPKTNSHPPSLTKTTSQNSNFSSLGLSPPLIQTCQTLGYTKPTPVQRALIPLILSTPQNILTLSATGSGKTASFALPLLHLHSLDPYGIYAIILTPTRELAKQISQSFLALSRGKISVALIIGGEDVTRQNCQLAKQPHFVVATPGRLAELCRGDDSYRPNFKKVKFVILDEADRLLSPKSGFERDVAEVLLVSTTKLDGDGKRVRRECRTLLFSATMTHSLRSLEEMAGGGVGRLPMVKVVVREDGSWDDGLVGQETKSKTVESSNGDESDIESSDEECSTPNLPAGLRQEYIFMPSRVREAYLLCAVRNLMTHGGRAKKDNSGWSHTTAKDVDISDIFGDKHDNSNADSGNKSKYPPAQSAIIFVPTCERAAHISGILTELGIKNVALHSLLSQNRRLASLGTFQSQRVRVLVATDVASRGLDIPEVDLVINAELPRKAVDYIHRVGRTARAGRRGRAVSLVGEQEVDLVHEAERVSGRTMEKCQEVTDEMAVKLLGSVAKASRLTKMKLMDIGFDELVRKQRERKRRDRRVRDKAEKRARKAMAKSLK